MTTATINGFQPVAISEFCETGSGGTPSRSKASQYFDGPIPWVKSGELREGIITSTEETITEVGLNESAAKLLPKNTLLVALYGATVGRIGVLGIEAATNQAVCHIIPDNRRADRTYLFYALQAQVPFWLSKRVGVGQPNISQGIIKDTKIPLPYADDPNRSIKEQKRIADILDKADAICQKRQEAIDDFGHLTASLFSEMFSNKLATSKWSDLSNYLEELRYGTSNKSGETGYTTLRIPNIVRGVIDLTNLKTVEASEQEYEKLKLLDDDVLFVRTNGNPDYVGRCAVFESSQMQQAGLNSDEIIYASYLIRARLQLNRLRPLFLQSLLQTSSGRKNVREKCRTSAGQYNINTKGIGSLQIPDIDIDVQVQFQRRVASLRPALAKLTEAESESHDLFNSLGQRAFKGEL